MLYRRCDRQDKALYVGISSNSPARTTQVPDTLKSHCMQLLIHQPSYSMFNHRNKERPTLAHEYTPLP
jgi:aryl-alcohol dehydrogenase-like predicted oxidoreductase